MRAHPVRSRVPAAVLAVAWVAVWSAAAPRAAEPGPATLVVYTEAWAQYTETDGSGFAWDILRAVYKPAGITIEKNFVPFARAVRNVTDGPGDAYLAAYLNGSDGAIFPEMHYDADELQALFPADRADAWQGKRSLETGTVGWIIGYRLGAYMDVDVTTELAKTRAQALRMLKHGRIDYYVDNKYEIGELLKDPPIAFDSSRYVRRDTAQIPMYVAFDDSARGRRFRDIWDRRFPKLLENGTIAEIYDTYGFGVWPFEQPREHPGA
jgi:polar amino acid transport system substrate-binding protein